MSRPSHRTWKSLVAATAAFALAACADSRTLTAPDAPGVAASRNPEFNSQRHIFHTRQYYAANGAGTSRASSTTGISYHGGTVLQNGTKVVAIYWNMAPAQGVNTTGYASLPSGSGAGTADGSLIGAFLRDMTNLTATNGSNYFKINGTYWGQQGSTVKITPTVTYTRYWNTTGSGCSSPSSAPTDNDMIALVNCGISRGYISYDASTVYTIFTGSGVNLGGGFGSQYCAYHTHGSNAAGTFYYAAMPYNQQYPSGCTSGFASPNADKAANSELNTLAHEIEETTTDALGTAWYDSRGYENADKCAWTWGGTASANGGTYNERGASGRYYLIQENWVNAGSGGCANGY